MFLFLFFRFSLLSIDFINCFNLLFLAFVFRLFAFPNNLYLFFNSSNSSSLEVEISSVSKSLKKNKQIALAIFISFIVIAFAMQLINLESFQIFFLYKIIIIFNVFLANF